MPAPSSNLPGRLWPGRPPSLFGLAPNGVCRACRVAAASGGLLPHRFTLTPPPNPQGGQKKVWRPSCRFGCGAVCFLWRFPRVAPPGCYPASCPVEPGLSSPGAMARSDGLSDSRIVYSVSEVILSCRRSALQSMPFLQRLATRPRKGGGSKRHVMARNRPAQ